MEYEYDLTMEIDDVKVILQALKFHKDQYFGHTTSHTEHLDALILQFQAMVLDDIYTSTPIEGEEE